MQRTLAGQDEFVPMFHRNVKQHCNPFLESDDFMPDWDEVPEENTGVQMFETQTAGTPISPIFRTPEELAAWLEGCEVGLIADAAATKEEWLRVIGASMTSNIDDEQRQ